MGDIFQYIGWGIAVITSGLAVRFYRVIKEWKEVLAEVVEARKEGSPGGESLTEDELKEIIKEGKEAAAETAAFVEEIMKAFKQRPKK